MSKLLKVASLACLALASPANAQGTGKDALEAIKQCATVENSEKRLECYDSRSLSLDKVIFDQGQLMAAVNNKTKKIVERAISAEAQINDLRRSAEASHDQVIDRAIREFGVSNPSVKTVGVIASKVINVKVEWGKSWLFALENGQVWNLLSKPAPGTLKIGKEVIVRAEPGDTFTAIFVDKGRKYETVRVR